MEFSTRFDTVESGWSTVYIGVTCYNFQIKIVLLIIRRFVFVLANSVDPDEMPHYAAFYLVLHCLPK